MITKVTVENFKRFQTATLDLGHSVVFIGPNNSGKTTALQAIALWDIGWRRWSEKRLLGSAEKRTGVTINRRDLTSIPMPSAKLLWHNLRTHKVEGGKTQPLYLSISFEGVHLDKPWACGLEFYYANEESFYCRLKGKGEAEHLSLAVSQHPIVYLPPMSGLADREHRKEPGEVSVLIGEGQTAQVLRNLCWQLYSKNETAWQKLVAEVRKLFLIELQEPRYIAERGELLLSFKEQNGIELDLSSTGRGCQQVILLLSYMLSHPGSILLLDEPDAHLEILRQRDIYNLITDIARSQGSQIIAASHSEVVLQEAAERDVVIAFVGQPHRIDTRQGKSQLRKALEKISISDYYLAEQKGWILYLEGATDLAILRALAERLGHAALGYIGDSVPVHYLGDNLPKSAQEHFHGLREAKRDLVGIAIFDQLGKELMRDSALFEIQWTRREIENYVTTRESLLAFCVHDLNENDLIELTERPQRIEVMENSITELEGALSITRRIDPWGPDIKVTDDFLDPLFERFYEKLGTPQRTFKRDYHELARVIPLEQIDPEVSVVLDAIVKIAMQAKVSS